MKTAILTLILTLATSAAFASELYIVEPMNCRGEIYGNTDQVHPSYTQLALTLNSARSVRRDQTFADSLEVSEDYAGLGEEVVFNHKAGSGGWYMGPLIVEGKNVTRKNLSNRGDDLNLKIVSSRRKNGQRFDKLVGTWFQEGSVAGAHGYKLTCIAQVVREAELVIDMTK